jgi:predicted TIM-barrel fold metal-dependent hydrolase
MQALIKRHPKTTIIWAHTGMGRVVRPVKAHAATLDAMLSDPAFNNLYFDISWTEVAKYIVATPESTQITANLINRHPDRFLFGTDEVAPANQEKYLKVYYQYGPLWKVLTPQASEQVRKRNYERIFDDARRRVRSWEEAHLSVFSPQSIDDSSGMQGVRERPVTVPSPISGR